jgi:hypothetical protein
MLPVCRSKLPESLVMNDVPGAPVNVRLADPLSRRKLDRLTTFGPGVPVMVSALVICPLPGNCG